MATQYSCLENPMDRGAWWAMVHKVSSDLDLSTHACRFNYGLLIQFRWSLCLFLCQNHVVLITITLNKV